MKNRQDKIKFLKGLQSGTRHICELNPEKVCIYISPEGTTIRGGIRPLMQGEKVKIIVRFTDEKQK